MAAIKTVFTENACPRECSIADQGWERNKEGA